MAKDDFENVEAGGIYQWKDKEVGTEFVGVYKGSEVQNTSQGEGTRHDFVTSEGEQSFFGGTILNQKLAKVEQGQLVKIQYTGDKKTNSGREMKEFSVAQAKATDDLLKKFGISEMKEVDDEIKEEDMPDLG